MKVIYIAIAILAVILLMALIQGNAFAETNNPVSSNTQEVQNSACQVNTETTCGASTGETCSGNGCTGGTCSGDSKPKGCGC